MFGAPQSSNFFNHLIVQNTVINDKMTSIDQKIVYETLSTGIFFNCCCASSESEVSEQGSSPNQHRDKNFQFLPMMHLDFSTTTKQIFYHKSWHTHCLYILNSDQWAVWLHEVC